MNTAQKAVVAGAMAAGMVLANSTAATADAVAAVPTVTASLLSGAYVAPAEDGGGDNHAIVSVRKKPKKPPRH